MGEWGSINNYTFQIKMNFKRFYINGDKFSFTIIYRGKYVKFHFENWWNNLMHKLTILTTK
jgi:hypothetical protein